ncbi:uncharacterized protein LOC122278417 [Carya illinoinensis]|uniref:uncharacterized protein LOC122278417 n=1 Tax=Carya illinoinensis TaxID=32201 RepID=UPI001C71F03E|nr:uncharacterized protein LOC122278417 [Carya illinoinensis]
METKCGRKRVEEVRRKLGFDCSFVVDSRGLSGGLAFIWKDRMDFSLENYSQSHISMNLSHQESRQQIMLTGFYGSPETARRGDSWNLLERISPKENKSWLCFGDFNEILYHHEKVGAASRPNSQMDAFRSMVDRCGLSDLGYEGSKYTWSNNREGIQFTKERLDRALGNLLWTRLFCECSVNALAAQTSDHCPLLINARRRIRWGPLMETKREKIFRFEASWNLHEACNNIITSSWSNQDSQQGFKIHSVMRKLNKCKDSLKLWSLTLRKERRDIQTKMNQLSKMQDSSTGSNTAAIKALKKDLFNSSDPRGVDECLSHVHHRVDREMNSKLSKQFTAGRGEDITKAALEVLNEGGEIAPINSTFIVLIPKVKNPQKVLDFRPISLCNVIYKVVSKVLSNRLKEILPRIIAPTQSAFVPGRMILDNVIVAFETLHSMSIKGKGQQGYMAIKLDMSKAYDRVEWEFLRKVMVKMGFNSRWVNLVMQCISTVSYSILVNGNPQGSFNPSRGIRQGDPLSPYLFILVSEVLSSLLNHAEVSKVIHGFQISRGKLSINHLFFADDSLLFCRANAREWFSIHLLLNIYEEASGQKLNKTKTSIFFSPNTRPATKEYILSLAGTRSSSCYEKYLGLPALIGRSKNAAFKSIIDRIKSRVGNWKDKLLSHAGKEILLKAVIQALPTYCMGVFKLPKSLLSDINRVMYQFWWGHLQNEKKVHWVSWAQMGKSKAAGGVGFRGLEYFNLALLAKQGWRLVQYPTSLAAQVLKAKYYPQHDFFQAKVGHRPSFIWRSFCAAKGVLLKGSIWRIGNGQKTSIWKDRWLPQPTTYMVQSPIHILQGDEKVERLINRETKQWDRGLVTDVFDATTAAVILKIPISSSSMEDKLVWLGTRDGSFTVKSAYHMQKEAIEMLKEQPSGGTQKQKSWTDCWKLQIPNATKTFLWRACLESLPTMLNLSKKKIVESPSCPICCREEESTIHALWNCSSAMDVWCQGPISFQKSSLREVNFKDLYEHISEQCDQKLIEMFSEFKTVQIGKVHATQVASIHPSVWIPPPTNCVKINWDAAVNVPQDRVGIGLVARDHEGSILVTKKLSLSSLTEPALAEASGAFHAANLAKDMEFRSVILEGDALQIVNGINHHAERWDRVGMVLLDTRVLLSSLAQWKVSFVRRGGNQVAHDLAKESLELAENSVVLVTRPPCNHVPSLP